MRVGVVGNPVVCQDQSEAMRAALSSRAQDVRWWETTPDDPGAGQAREAVEWGAEVVVVCGGDGTVRACAEGLAGLDVPLAIMPAGTGNLLARNLKLPTRADEVVEAALAGSRVALDVGRVEGETFAVMAGAGLDATIMSETSSEAKDRLGVLSYVVAGARHLRDEPMSASIRVDGGDPIEAAWVTILIGNLGGLPGGMDLFPDSHVRDGALELIALAGGSLASTMVGAATALAGGEHDHILRRHGREFVIEFREATSYELDGEARDPVGRLRFDVAPGALHVCVARTDDR